MKKLAPFSPRFGLRCYVIPPRRGYFTIRYHRTDVQPALAAHDVFKTQQIFAFDINDAYISILRKKILDASGVHWHVAHQNFFTYHWIEMDIADQFQ